MSIYVKATNQFGATEYWSEIDHAWTSLNRAAVFTQADRAAMQAGIEGRWVDASGHKRWTPVDGHFEELPYTVREMTPQEYIASLREEQA